MDFDKLEIYLPKYLSDADQRLLFDQLKEFPENIGKIYSSNCNFDNGILQFDVVENIPFVNLPDTTIKYTKVLILSNSCDIDPKNKRNLPPTISYIPLINIELFIKLLESKDKDKTQIENIIKNITSQKTTNMLYLPKGQNLDKDSIALLDRTLNCDRDVIFKLAQSDNNKKIISLSNYGFYLFLIKLSIHFTRIQEGIHRG